MKMKGIEIKGNERKEKKRNTDCQQQIHNYHPFFILFHLNYDMIGMHATYS